MDSQTQHRINVLLLRAAELRDLLRIVEAELDTFRAKCRECRCRLLPGSTCECCSEDFLLCDDIGPITGKETKR